jgi:ABC-2 type transport system permease protein
MRKMLIIAARDYNAAVRSKAFLVSLVFLPLIMGGSVGLQWLLKDTKDTRTRRYAVLDRTGGKLYDALAAAAEKRTESPPYKLEKVAPAPDRPETVAEQRLDLSDRVRQGDIRGFVEIGADVGQKPPEGANAADERFLVRFQSDSPLSREFPGWVRTVLSDALHDKYGKEKKLTPEDVHTLQQPVPLLERSLSKRDAATGAIRDGEEGNFLVSFFLPFGLVMIVFMMIFVGATPLLQGVVEEKMQRIAEVLLGSVRPFTLMMGKLLGTVGVATTLSVVYLGSSFAALQYYGYADFLTPRVVLWLLAFQTLGVLMYGSLFVAVGAACTSTQETQTMLMPVMLVGMLPLFVMVHVIMEPDSALATWISLIPTATPMLMTARVAIPPGVPTWQPLLGIGLVLVTTLLCVYAAGRIFRVGILMQGKGASFGDLLRWLVRG